MRVTWLWIVLMIGAVQIGGLNLNLVLQWIYAVTTQTVDTAIDATDEFKSEPTPPTVERL